MVFIFSCDWHRGEVAVLLQVGTQVPPNLPGTWGRLCGSALWLSHLLHFRTRADLLVQELSCRHGKGHMGDSRGLSGNNCPLPSLAMQMLLRNGAETAGLWGLVSKKEDLFLSDAGRGQFKWIIYVQRSIFFPYCFLPSHAELCTGQQGWYLIAIYNVFILDEIASCYRPVGRYLFYLILIKLMLNIFTSRGRGLSHPGAHLYWSSQSLNSGSRCNRNISFKHRHQ